MYHDEEKKIYKAKEEYDNIKIPSNIDDFIIKGINKGRDKNKSVKVSKFISIAASLLIMTFITSIAVSPAFADYVSQIPGIGYFIKLFSYDQGIQSALENEFMQVINISDEHEGIKLTLEGIIVDESRMVLFYNVETDEKNIDIYLTDVRFENKKGDDLRASYGYSRPEYEEKYNKFKGTIDVSFSEETELTDEILMAVKVAVSDRNKDKTRMEQSVNKSHFNRENTPIWDREIEEPFKISFKIDKEKFENLKETYIVNSKATVQGQTFIVQRVTIHPTRISIDIEYDPNNSMSISSFDDLRLVDKNGNEFTSIRNGITASYIGENAIRVYMQSNYFKLTDELYLVGSRLMALDKERAEVVVDIEGAEIIKQPDDRFKKVLINKNYTDNTIEMEITFEQEVPSEQMNIFKNVALKPSAYDENGREISTIYVGASSTAYEGKQIYKKYIKIEMDQVMGRYLSFGIHNYPDIIEEPFKIKIK